MSTILIIILLDFAVGILARPSIQECRLTQLGNDYQGKVSVTTDGLECQRWDSQSPHAHNFTKIEYFPDSSFEDLMNYCRNPDDDEDGPYCFTTDQSVPRQTCSIPLCSDYPECRLTDEGTEYLGFKSMSSSGTKCVEWSGTDYPGEDSNYCRNPDKRTTGPWCYVTGNEAESCGVPFCKPSASCKRTDKGLEYVGTVSWTVNSRICQRWDTQYPHSHRFSDGDFPDGTVTGAQNFCRNPNGAEKPWCHTNDPNVVWEYCQISICQECKASTAERNYFGAISTTKSGHTCQRWDSQTPHKHGFTDSDRFPDASVEAASNYCRNPDGKAEGPWCYTRDASKEWDYCDIPTCKGISAEDPIVPLAKHVVHIGIDGIKPSCMIDEMQNLPNIMKRLREEASHTFTNARTTLQTTSGPAWGATLCGMSMELTGMTDNKWIPPWMGNFEPLSPATGNVVPLPCVFQTLKAQDATIRTASYYDWRWIKYLSNKGYPGYVDKDVNCRDGYKLCDIQIANDAEKYISNIYNATDKSYSFIYFGEIDILGHNSTWCSAKYNDGMAVVDAQVGQILDAIDKAGKWDDTIVILSSDHGGHDYIHGTWIDDDILVPFFIRGPGIRKNYSLNEPVGVWDIVPTATRVLGLKPSPWWNGRIIWEAFTKRSTPIECPSEPTSMSSSPRVIATGLVWVAVIILWMN